MKLRYYDIDIGLYPTHVKLCFDEKGFNQILKDFEVPEHLVTPPLNGSVAETHTIVKSGQCLVILIVDIQARADDAASLAGTVAHETCHVVDSILEHIGEPREQFGPESRAYLTQHIVEQVFYQCIVECVNAERKRARAAARKESKGKGGTVPKVDKPGDDGGARSVGDLPVKDNSRGDERPKGEAVSPPRVHDTAASTVRHRSPRLIDARNGAAVH
jgi:hypothetical protein